MIKTYWFKLDGILTYKAKKSQNSTKQRETYIITLYLLK